MKGKRLASLAIVSLYRGTNQSVPGVWFVLEGTGSLVRVSSGQPASVYSGPCDALTCIQESGDFSFLPTTIFESVLGEEYLVYVYGPRGDFNITVEELDGQPNDTCEGATALEINGGPVSGDTTESMSESGLDVCGAVLSLGTVGGLFYTFVGSGETLQIGVNATFDSQLLLYSGRDCDNLICLDGNDDTFLIPGFQSALEFDSVDGEVYTILVHGYSSSFGMFEVQVTQLVPQENDDCEDARELTINGPSISGDTSISNSEFGLDTCGGVSSLGTVGGLFFSFLGNGGRLQLGVDAQFDSQLLVYSGSCDDLECVDGNDDTGIIGFQSALEFDSVDGQVYIALVHGFGSSSGTFDIELNELVPPENDNCTGAIELEINGPGIAGDTSTSISEADTGLETCGSISVGFGAGGVWFTFVGNGERLLLGVDALLILSCCSTLAVVVI